MFDDLSDLRDSLLAARLLREEVLALPLAPDAAAAWRDRLFADNARGGSAAANRAALGLAATDAPGVVRAASIEALARAAGSAARRAGPGVPFRGTAAPPPSLVADLHGELLETVNAPAAVEGWPAPVRAFALHFLLRLVQPFDAPPATVAFAAEVFLLAADGFRADLVLLPEPDVGAEHGTARADPDEFVRARMHRLVERLGEGRDLVRDACARAAMAAWAREPRSGLHARQSALVRRLAGDAAARITFQAYVDAHAGRRAPSLRSLQRDWQGLRERGLLREDGAAHRLAIESFQFGAVAHAPASTSPRQAGNPPSSTATSA